jgi:hypothetical protein
MVAIVQELAQTFVRLRDGVGAGDADRIETVRMGSFRKRDLQRGGVG